MKDWKKILISPKASIRSAIETIDNSAIQIALVAGPGGRLLGTVTDGDVRRGILKGIALDEPVERIMNPSPTVMGGNESRDAILAVMKNKGIHQIPIVDPDGLLIGLELIDEIVRGAERDNVVVLMAGGLGSRLRPLTDDCPKPLLKVGNKPILETIIENFIEYGFRRFYITINYKADMIEKHFGDGSKWGIEISYIRESERMGTAGSLGAFSGKFGKPLFVMNGDLLTRVNFSQLLSFHAEHRAKATMCVREYDFQVPYGVVKIDKGNLVDIEEKPVHRFFVSAGIYVLEPEILELIPSGGYLDMPAFFRLLLDKKMQAAVFPIREYWLDIGRQGDFDRANGEFPSFFE